MRSPCSTFLCKPLPRMKDITQDTVGTSGHRNSCSPPGAEMVSINTQHRLVTVSLMMYSKHHIRKFSGPRSQQLPLRVTYRLLP